MIENAIHREESVGLAHTGTTSQLQLSSSEPQARVDGVETHVDEVRDFAHKFDLMDHVDILQNASLILQSDELPDSMHSLSTREKVALHEEVARKWRQPTMLYFTIFVCSIGAIEQGWAQTSMNGANLYFPKEFGIDSDSQLDNFIVGLINSGIYLSAGIIGAWLSDPFNRHYGRRGAVLLGGILCLLSNLGASVSQTWPQLLAFRVVLGAGLGLNASTVSVYAAECAPASIRGGLAVSWQMFTAFGVFLGFVANAAFYSIGDSAWRLQLAAPAIPTIPLIAMLYVCPESPAWYLKNGLRYDYAYRSLSRLRNTELQAAKELYSIYLQSKLKVNKSGPELPFAQKFAELFTIPRVRRATTASYVVMLSQQLCGINIIAFYSSTIFSESGFSKFGALIASCVFGFINFVGAFPAIFTMDTFGRRSLLLLTLPFMAFTMLAAGLSSTISPENPLHLGLLASLVYLFCALYSPGMGPVPNTYSAEAFPLSHREVGMSFAVATANCWAAVLSLTFPRILSVLKAPGAFSLYAGLNVLALILIFLFLPETRLRTLDELDDVFSISTRAFIKYQITEYLPWVVRRYVLQQKNSDIKPLTNVGEYQAVVQDEEEEDDDAPQLS